MATFASDFDKHSVPMPTWSTPTPTVPSSPGAQATALGSYNNVSGQTPVSSTSQGLQSIQSQMQQDRGLSSSIDPNLTQDAFAGNLAMSQRQSQAASQYGMTTPTPTGPSGPTMGGQSDALSRYLAQATSASAGYTPTAVQGVYGGKDNSYTLTRSGLSEPDPRQFTSQADYQTALNAYQKLALNEEKTALSSDAQGYVNSQNAYQKMIDEMQRRTSMIEGEQKELARTSAIKRNDLANRLAARGISENTDSSAQQQFAELDRLNAEAQQAVRTAASIDAKEFISGEEARMSAALKARVKEIGMEQDRIASIEAAESKNAQDLLNIEAKNKDYESKIADRIADNERQARETLLKEMLTPAQLANLMAKTDYTGAQTDYLSGAKTDLTNSQIAKTDAQTNRITTLLPAEKARIEAQVKKLLTPPRSGSGGAATGAALTKQFLSLTDNLNADLATGKRDWGQTFDLVKGSYPGVPDDLINQALGGSYDPGTDTATGWAAPGAYESVKNTLSPTDQLLMKIVDKQTTTGSSL